MHMSKIYLLRVLSLIWEFRFNVSGVNMSRVRWAAVWGGGLGLPAGGICASQGTF